MPRRGFAQFPHLALVLVLALAGCAQKPEDRPFGAHSLVKHALRGTLYNLKKGTVRLPDFAHSPQKGTIFATRLNAMVTNDVDGFDGVTDRNEWFALDYKTKMTVAAAGTYGFRLVSDDGSRLLIDGRTVIDNDGVHYPPKAMAGTAALTAGAHAVEVQYFKGPHYQAALQLSCTAPGGAEGVFPFCGGLTLETPTQLSDHLWWIWLLGLLVVALGWWLLAGRKKPV
jgi:hypothetical protein